MSDYTEHITILSNSKNLTKIKICARSLTTKILKWERIYTGDTDDVTDKPIFKWKPLKIRFVDWLEAWRIDVDPTPWNHNPSPYIIFVPREKILELMIRLDMMGIETWCRLKRRGLFTEEEYKLIKRVGEDN